MWQPRSLHCRSRLPILRCNMQVAIEDKLGKPGRPLGKPSRQGKHKTRKSKSQPAVLDPDLTLSPVNEPRMSNTNVISMADNGTQYKNYIHVTEEDLRRYGHDLEKLRERQVVPWSQRERRVRQLSFGEAFEVNCRKPAEVLDPWRDIPDPESFRPPNEGDLFVNQVVPQSPRKIEREEPDNEADEVQELLEMSQRRSSSKHSISKDGYRRMSSNISAGSTSTVASTNVSREVSRASSKESAAAARANLQRQSSIPLPPVARSRSLMMAGASLAG